MLSISVTLQSRKENLQSFYIFQSDSLIAKKTDIRFVTDRFWLHI